MMRDSTVTLPFGVADLGSGIGVFRHLPSGIDAVDLRTGSVVWRAGVHGLPVAASGGRVLVRLLGAEDDTLEFAILDAADGRELARSETTLLPHPVSARDSGFALSAAGEEERFVVEWKAADRYRGGAPPHEEWRPGNARSGAIAIDAAGKVSAAVQQRGAAAVAETPPMSFEMTPDYRVVARESASGRVLWEHGMGTPAAKSRPPLRQ